MVKTGIGRVHLSWGVPWSRRTIVMKRGAPWTGDAGQLSVFQLRACLSLAEGAYSLFDNKEARGKIRYKGVNMPAIAVLVGERVKKGIGIYGGPTPEDKRRRDHKTAESTIAALRALIEAKGR